MTTIVPTTEEDPALFVVRFASEASWADAGPDVVESQVSRLCAEAQECIVRERWKDLVSLMLASADVIFSTVSDKDLECIFTVICNLVTKAETMELALDMAKLIASKLTQRPVEKSAVRLKIMFNLYNLLDNPYAKFVVYMSALELAVSGNVTEHIITSFKKMDNFLKEWNIEIEDQRRLFRTVSNILREKKSAKDSFKFLTKYLATFSAEDANLNEAREEAVRSIVEFVKTPDMFQCDLLNMPAVAQLENDDEYASLYHLLKIFLTQRLATYLDFIAANPDLLNKNGLVHEDCVAKMRLISLVDLSSAGVGQISYALIRDVLQIEDDEVVETWVVKAIKTKVVDCKMDQMNRTVIVSRCIDRTFGQLQWQTLRSKLATWRGNIANVINTIQSNKLTEDVTPAAQTLMIH